MSSLSSRLPKVNYQCGSNVLLYHSDNSMWCNGLPLRTDGTRKSAKRGSSNLKLAPNHLTTKYPVALPSPDGSDHRSPDGSYSRWSECARSHYISIHSRRCTTDLVNIRVQAYMAPDSSLGNNDGTLCRIEVPLARGSSGDDARYGGAASTCWIEREKKIAKRISLVTGAG